ncbi:hypothetical protein [Stieleria mannarensis]|uniref:hypothetical protein n=1 Tax=Stieleria mannarensis TaxID=2755585 RepID=UPI001601935B|nr:hypothetical protein [Rhodopirellula sp. JC639]
MNKPNLRNGQTMLELIAATIVISIALVPALKLTRTRIANTEALERAETRLALCTGKLEEELAYTAARWELNSHRGNFSSLGQPDVCFQVSKSDALAAGGRPGSLAAIDVLVWHDDDADDSLDAEEQRVHLATKIAKLESYAREFNGP